MSLIWELLFDRAHRRLRRLGLLGILVAFPVIVYVEIPIETAAIQSELQRIVRTIRRNVHESERRARTDEHRRADASR